jgi:hypothetical protein
MAIVHAAGIELAKVAVMTTSLRTARAKSALVAVLLSTLPVALAACGGPPMSSPEEASEDLAQTSPEAASTTCSASDYKTIATIGEWYGVLVAEEAAVSADLTNVSKAISQGESLAEIDADVTKLGQDAATLDASATSAVAAVDADAPSNASVVTAKADAQKAFTSTVTAAAAIVTLADAALTDDPSALKSLLGQIAALSETFATLATEYAQVYTDVSTSPCLKK